MTPLAPGVFVDDAQRYELVSRIATGGMGEVWRATDTVLHRDVAVKLLKAEYADDSRFRTRFETEARHAASLHHPGVAAVFDFGEASPVAGSTTPVPYLVMELVDGQPLSVLLRPSAPMDATAVRDLLAQAADALGVAHARGLVHRDVKPANLIVTPDRRVKVTDFGIARAAEGMALTETGQVMGTPQYISPEQAEGHRATPASDVYSLGVVAFECLAGRPPFSAETPIATAIAHVRQPVPDLPASVPPDLAAVVRRALSKAPGERYADGSAFAAALRQPAAAAAAAGGLESADRAESRPTTVLPAAPVTRAEPVDRAESVGLAESRPRSRRTPMAWLPWVGIALLLLIAFAVWQGVIAGRDDPGDDNTPQQPTQTQSPTETPTETATETPESPSPTTEEPATVEVDPGAYVDRDHKDVEKELEELGLLVDEVEIENPGDEGEGLVESVEPTGQVEVGSTVTVTYYGKVPDDSSGEGSDGEGEGEGDGSSGNEGQGNGQDQGQGNDE